MSGRRLIGIDLAWGKLDGGEPAGSGCAELVWKGDELELTRLCALGRVEEIVKWIRPDDGDWVVAIDAPLVITNQTGQRTTDNQVGRVYGNHGFSAHSANLTNSKFGPHYQGRMILKRLRELGGTLVEKADDIDDGPLFFETYPHVVMVELFGRTFKYKKKKGRTVPYRNAEQRRLAEVARENLCSEDAHPRLRTSERLAELLPEPFPDLGGQALKDREDKLDGLICAYTAAWLDAGRELVGLGPVGEGVIIAPRVQGIGSVLP